MTIRRLVCLVGARRVAGCVRASPVRWFYSGPDAKRLQTLQGSMMTNSGFRGRDTASVLFEKRISLVNFTDPSDFSAGVDEPGSITVSFLCRHNVSDPLQAAPCMTDFADASLSTVPSTAGARGLQMPGDVVLGRTPTGVEALWCWEPNINARQFRAEEAEVEMMSAFRNIYAEVALLPHVTCLRLLPMCLLATGDNAFLVPKLNHRAAIKGYHRLSKVTKETLMMREGLRVEIMVPTQHHARFEAAFAEDAWPVPESTLTLPRRNLYPGLAPPPSLLACEGWIGKRPELVEAIETGGLSLEGAQQCLDGEPVQRCDSLEKTLIPGVATRIADRIEKERAAAEAQGLQRRALTPLTAGLQGS